MTDKIQNYYGIAIRSNTHNIEAMQSVTIAAFFHCCSSREKPMHGQCPIGADGFNGLLEVLKALGINAGYYTLRDYKSFDIIRVSDLKRHSLPRLKSSRGKKYRAQRKKKFNEISKSEDFNSIVVTRPSGVTETFYGKLEFDFFPDLEIAPMGGRRKANILVAQVAHDFSCTFDRFCALQIKRKCSA
ncbi:uncharacterized protein TNCV_4979691 [Trichonephila clavipes]|nr:uncharacterized protein TNCV_4979691 [Trichonephila clavipes]